MKITDWICGMALAGLALTPLARAQQEGAAAPAPNQARPAAAAVTEHKPGDLPGPIDSLQDLQDSAQMLFKLADANNDGQISQQEAVGAGNRIVGGFFFQADANGDGTVSQDEARQARDAVLREKPMLRYLVSKARAQKAAGGNNANANNANAGTNPNPLQGLANLLDTNNDKQIQASELRQMVQTTVQGLFATADTNRDNQLSPTELNAMTAGMIRSAAQAAFQAADDDHNSQLSRAEFDKAIVEPANVVFSMLDANNDGQLSQQELQAAQQFIASRVQAMRVPEPANSPRNLIRTGRRPAEVAPVPAVPAPGGAAPAPGAAPTPR